MKTLEQIEVGDRVFVGDGRNPRRRLSRVGRLTPTQIVLEGGARYSRNGFGLIGVGHAWIKAVATPDECEAWEAEQARKAREAAECRAERERVDAKQQELTALFGTGAYVSESHDPDVEPWEVHFFLSEEGVRRLAALWEADSVPAR